MDLNLSFLQQDNIVAEFKDLVELHSNDYSGDKDLSKASLLLVQNEISEEEKEISTNPRLSEWFRLITTKSCPLDCRIDINSITARALAKALWDDCQIKLLDLSNLGLSDKAGCYISRALKNNKTLVSLELNGNQLGPNTCIELAKSLTSNSTLVFLSLASNRLTKINDCKKQKEDCIEELAQAIANNTSLTTLSLYRCGIGHEPMKAICHAVCQNSSLVSVEIGYNEYDNSDVLLMNKQLEKNRTARELKLCQVAEIAKAKEIALQEEQLAKEKMEKEIQAQKYLEEQKQARAEARRIEMERLEYEKKKEWEKIVQIERIQKLEEERVNAKKKGKKGGKKGNSKKGKKK